MKNLKKTLHLRKWLGVESPFRGDITEFPLSISYDGGYAVAMAALRGTAATNPHFSQDAVQAATGN